MLAMSIINFQWGRRKAVSAWDRCSPLSGSVCLLCMPKERVFSGVLCSSDSTNGFNIVVDGS